MMENYFNSNHWSVFEMNNNKRELLSPCGLYCGVCRIYIAHKNKDLEFKKEILPTLNYFGAKSVDDIACTGCKSDGVLFPFCQKCSIKDCTNEKKIEGCYQCNDFPCKILTNWPDLLDKKVILRSVPAWRVLGTEKWIKEEEKRYLCPNCGELLFHGAKKCRKCNYKVDLD